MWVFDGHLVMTHDEGLEESRNPYRDHCCQSASNDAPLNPRRAVESLQEAILNQGKGNAVSTLTWRAASSTGELLNSMFQSGDIGDRYASRGQYKWGVQGVRPVIAHPSSYTYVVLICQWTASAYTRSRCQNIRICEGLHGYDNYVCESGPMWRHVPREG